MGKLFRTTIVVAAVISAAMFTGCKKDEPTPSGGNGGNGGNNGPASVAVTGVSISKQTLSLVEGSSETLIATVNPSNATNKAVSWKSSDAATATVDNNGKVTAVKAGSTTITVTTSDGSKTATCSVTVTAKTVSVSEVTLDKTELEITEGESAQLTVTVKPDDASDKSVEWTSSDAKVTAVDDTGKVTAGEAGTVTITVKTKDGGKTASCTVTVIPKVILVEGVSIEPATLEMTEGETFQLKAYVTPADANQEVDWASPSPHIATIDQNGLLTAIAPGTVRIAVRSKEFTDKQGFCDVTVLQNTDLKGISLDADEINLAAGSSRTLTVVFYPEYAANKNVSWSSSDPAVASVTDGKVIAIKEGTATVTATSDEGGFKAECLVNVAKVEGPFIYSIGWDNEVYVNGDLDPRKGMFNSASFRFYTAHYLDAVGEDLITYEVYFNKSVQEPWICKNREPIINLSGHESDYVYGLSCRNEVYAVLYHDREGTYKVVKAKQDGTITDYTIKGSATQTYFVSMAVAPSGDIYVSCQIRDSFNQHYLAQYKLAADGTVSEKLIEKNSIARPRIGVTESGDIYIVAGNYDEEGKESVRLYKNGVFEKAVDKVDQNLEVSLRCVGNDVYVAVIDETARQVRVFKNGVKYRILDYSQEIALYYSSGYFEPMWVTSGGDIYLSVIENGSMYRVYKNGKNIYTADNSGTLSYQPFCLFE